MKIVHVSDAHLVPAGERLLGLDPLARLEVCLADIERHHADAAAVVITGDLSETGAPDTYRALRTALSRTRLPVRLLMGNHDNREAYAEVFPESAAPDGYIHGVFDGPDGRLIFLDTLDQGAVTGRLCATRLAWLSERLAEAKDRSAFLFMHHPPGRVHLPALDSIGLSEPQAFFEVVERHGNVRHIFAGHLHRLITGRWQGVPFTILRSTNHQTAVDFVSEKTSNSFEPALYSIVLAKGEDMVIHFHEFPTGQGA
ncbi:phosphodiesterase [Rhizobiaceae bacterium n13]|uniref:phosphodiesterase n=1 Tax=Ferirhizobium litorale TaxID=2927786 RepID=UPI0024B2A29B|nr:phosphodiesterase [Fererhizobium litorale]MDI7864503.1 phosphodiesterase [Fererhizobium litorale]